MVSITAAAIVAAGSVASGAISASAAGDAADVQANAANNASALQFKQFEMLQKLLSPYTAAGVGALSDLRRLTGTNEGGNPLTAALTKPFAPTMAQLSRTPGYQFTRTQGLQATQNSFAAQGLGQSGAALKGAANYAEGLASTTFQQQFDNYLRQNSQIANILGSQVSMGENAAAGVGNAGMTTATNAGNFLTSGAAAQAGGIVGAANAYGGAISNVANIGALYGMNSSGLFGGAGGAGHGVIAADTGGAWAGG